MEVDPLSLHFCNIDGNNDEYNINSKRYLSPSLLSNKLHPSRSRIIHNSFKVFIQFHKEIANNKIPPKVLFPQCYKRYIEIINNELALLQNLPENKRPRDLINHLTILVTLLDFSSIYTPAEDELQISKIIRWIVMVYTDNVIENIPVVFDWNKLTNALVRGRFSEAIEILQSNPEAKDEDSIYRKTIMIIQSHPQYMNDITDRILYEKKWSTFHSILISLKSIYEIDDNWLKIFNILSGNKTIISRLSSKWSEILVSLLLYASPVIDINGLQSTVENCIKLNNKNNSKEDSKILMLLKGDLSQIIKFIMGYKDSWLIFHITDIMITAGLIPSIQSNEISLREYIINDYCSYLQFYGRNYYYISLQYLEVYSQIVESENNNNNNNNKSIYNLLQKELIHSYPIVDDNDACLLIHYSKQYHYTEYVNEICKIRGIDCMNKCLYGNAVMWFLRGKYYNLIVSVLATVLIDNLYGRNYLDVVKLVLDELSGCNNGLIPNLELLNKYYSVISNYTAMKKLINDKSNEIIKHKYTEIISSSIYDILKLSDYPTMYNNNIIINLFFCSLLIKLMKLNIWLIRYDVNLYSIEQYEYFITLINTLQPNEFISSENIQQIRCELLTGYSMRLLK